LAYRAGLNRNYVGIIERSENAATVDVLEQLARALNVSAAELLLDRPASLAEDETYPLGG
jgi:transcriptional regulator with XRE-family HTH domain